MNKIFLLLGFCAVLASCQKEYQVPDLVIEGPSDGLPSSYTLYSADDPGIAYVTRFVYDGSKRVSKVISVEIDSTVTPMKKDTFMTETFVYNGSSTSPVKVIIDNGSVPDTTYFQYDNSGKLIKDSSVSLGVIYMSKVITYTNTGFKVLTKAQGTANFEDSMAVSSNNLNYVQRKVSGYPQYTQNMQLTYDTQDNPLYAQNIRGVRFHMDLTDIGWPFYSSKNVLKTFSQSGFASGSFTVENSFNNSNKLKKQIIKENNAFVASITYEY